ncbi:uncharacterized protein LOC119696141 isoform X5 [Motacilla alba alba]|uniref:uncharacterized protein LOC119696141 isoform X5 n=1 Tax=Motacilla alba alba TaxID=1094192 RepID=UPI0018D5833E|nr:uncharacterized protein LOC119696141 isoform X5 [Motacilla alba alba]
MLWVAGPLRIVPVPPMPWAGTPPSVPGWLWAPCAGLDSQPGSFASLHVFLCLWASPFGAPWSFPTWQHPWPPLPCLGRASPALRRALGAARLRQGDRWDPGTVTGAAHHPAASFIPSPTFTKELSSRRRKKGEFIHKTCGKSIQGNTSGQLLQFRQLPKDRRIRGGNWELFQLGKLQSGCTGSSRSPSFLPSFPACLPACLPAAAAARIPISAHPAERGRTERGERGAPRARPAPVPPTPPAEPAESDSYCGEEFSCTRANT